MKKRTKKIGGTLTRILMALVVISSWAVLGVALALKSANVQMSGSISFKATEIFADITGSVTGTATTNTLGDINIKSDTTQEQINAMATGWSNMTLDFTSDNLITVTVNITNKATDRTMWATITDGIDGANLNVTRYVGEEQSPIFDVLEISANTTSTIKIEMSVANLNTSIENSDFALGIALANEEPAVADASEYEGSLVFKCSDDGTASVCGNGSDPLFEYNTTGDVVIPERILSDGKVYVVTSIASDFYMYGFSNCSIDSIYIPKTLTNIPSNALHCKTLTSMIVDSANPVYSSYENGIYKGTELVAGCQTTIIKEGTTSIGNSAFCLSGIESIVIPSSVSQIGDYAFSNSALKTIVLSEGIKSIGSGVFASCTSLKSVTIPASVNYIGSKVFNGDINLYLLQVAEGNLVYTSYGNGIYQGTTLIVGCKNTVIKEGTTIIGKNAFCRSGLTSIDIPQSVVKIDDWAFSGCDLTSIVLPSNLQHIGSWTFSSTKLTTVTIPASVNYIDTYAFYMSHSLSTAIFEETTGWFQGDEGVTVSDQSEAAGVIKLNATPLTRVVQ